MLWKNLVNIGINTKVTHGRNITSVVYRTLVFSFLSAFMAKYMQANAAAIATPINSGSNFGF